MLREGKKKEKKCPTDHKCSLIEHSKRAKMLLPI
jgi:hypothetical protein